MRRVAAAAREAGAQRVDAATSVANAFIFRIACTTVLYKRANGSKFVSCANV